jgi:hypothetical protein
MQFTAGRLSYEDDLEEQVRKMKQRTRRKAQRRKKALAGLPEDTVLIKKKPGPKPRRLECKKRGCRQKHYAFDVCEKHYRRARRAAGGS